MKEKKYDEAILWFRQAEKSSDKPANNDIEKKIAECEKKKKEQAKKGQEAVPVSKPAPPEDVVMELELGEGSYYGKTRNHKPNGHGKLDYLRRDERKTYEGDWVNGEQTGQGVMVYRNGDRYEGAFKNGVMSGKGIYYYSNNEKYNGNFERGVRSGQGTFEYANGERYVGGWEDDQKNGKGVLYWENGDKK